MDLLDDLFNDDDDDFDDDFDDDDMDDFVIAAAGDHVQGVRASTDGAVCMCAPSSQQLVATTQ